MNMQPCELSSILKAIDSLRGALYSIGLSKSESIVLKQWLIGAVVTAPGAGDTLLKLTRPNTLWYGVELACGEANTILVTWNSKSSTYTKRYPTPSAGTLVLVSDYAALNEGLPADPDITITVESAAGAGIKYQASLLYGVL
jgi:hypothetical protein